MDRWATIEAPDDDGEQFERSDSGENYIAKLRVVKPPAVIVVVKAKRLDEEIAKHGVLDGEDDSEKVSEVIHGFFYRFFRRH